MFVTTSRKVKVVLAFHNECTGCALLELALLENIVSLKPTSVEPVLPWKTSVCSGPKVIHKLHVLILNFGNEYKFNPRCSYKAQRSACFTDTLMNWQTQRATNSGRKVCK